MEDQIANELTAEWTVASLKSLVGSASDVTKQLKSRQWSSTLALFAFKERCVPCW